MSYVCHVGILIVLHTAMLVRKVSFFFTYRHPCWRREECHVSISNHPYGCECQLPYLCHGGGVRGGGVNCLTYSHHHGVVLIVLYMFIVLGQGFNCLTYGHPHWKVVKDLYMAIFVRKGRESANYIHMAILVVESIFICQCI